jgi:hypothetical protein
MKKKYTILLIVSGVLICTLILICSFIIVAKLSDLNSSHIEKKQTIEESIELPSPKVVQQQSTFATTNSTGNSLANNIDGLRPIIRWMWILIPVIFAYGVARMFFAT